MSGMTDEKSAPNDTEMFSRLIGPDSSRFGRLLFSFNTRFLFFSLMVASRAEAVSLSLFISALFLLLSSFSSSFNCDTFLFPFWITFFILFINMAFLLEL